MPSLPMGRALLAKYSDDSIHLSKYTSSLQGDAHERQHKLLQEKKSLPIAAVERRILEEVQRNDTLIIVGETGSGKTTQLPQFLLKAGFCHDRKIIGVTQPRRVAAVTVAKRVAEECNTSVGQRVGYSIRFEDKTSCATKIKFMTDGLLLREALLDPLLLRYSVIIIDEAHERTIHTDVLLGLLKGVQSARSKHIKENCSGNLGTDEKLPYKNCNVQYASGMKQSVLPLKLIIMSASLDGRVFSHFFGGAKAVQILGRQFPVDVYYTYNPEPDYLDASLLTIFQIHLEEGPGDVLVFLTGQEEIESLERLIRERTKHLPEGSEKIKTAPIHATLPSEQQMHVFSPAPHGYRKVVLATNIAETSITIPGIKYVVDPGLVKSRMYNPSTGMESLVIVPISKAQALQRSGRAGREGPGKCFRLFPESEFDKLQNSTIPEIKRCNLCNVVLQLKALGIDDVIGFDFLEKPSRMAIIKSLEQLLALGALTDDFKLSDSGRQMAQLPLDPTYAKALILSKEFRCSEEMLISLAMLSVESIFYSPREKFDEARLARESFSSIDGDHITFINVFRAFSKCLDKHKDVGKAKSLQKHLSKWCQANFVNCRSLLQAVNVHRQIQGLAEKMGITVSSCGDDMIQFCRCLAASFFLNAALRLPDGSYRALSSGQTVKIHPSSVLFSRKPECIIFNELVRTNNNYVRSITRIDSLWLLELAPQYYAAQN